MVKESKVRVERGLESASIRSFPGTPPDEDRLVKRARLPLRYDAKRVVGKPSMKEANTPAMAVHLVILD